MWILGFFGQGTIKIPVSKIWSGIFNGSLGTQHSLEAVQDLPRVGKESDSWKVLGLSPETASKPTVVGLSPPISQILSHLNSSPAFGRGEGRIKIEKR
jgi:hypothetical protein